MRKTFTLRSFYLCLMLWGIGMFTELRAQYAVDSTLTPAGYINNLVGLGVSYSNIQFQGDNQAIGYFTGANNALGFNSGIILATGPVAESADPNFFGSINNGLDVMPDLTNEVPPTCIFGGANDGVILQFDFVPQSTPVSFNYIFASDEYPTFVCSEYNDAFAFLISGPGIAGQQNLAIVPGTNDPITISTINNGSIGGAGDATNIPCVLTNSQYFNNTPPAGINYSGFTQVMTAVADVIPCQTYTLKLLLADYCDQSLSSAVFLEANSFGAAPIAISQTTLNGDSTTYEGCAPATLVFSRQNPDPFDYVFPFTLTGTAQSGTDYSPVPPQVIIPAGQTSTTLNISAITDGIVEGNETVELTYQTICGQISTIVYITEPPVVAVTPAPAPSICEGQGPVTISGTATSGVNPFTYTWNNGLPNGSSASVNPLVQTTYTLTATDFCGNSATADITVQVGNTPDVPTIAATTAICENDNIQLSASTSSTTATLVWSGPNSFSQNGGSSVTINNAMAVNGGVYSVYATEFGCNSAPATVNQVVNSRPVITNIGSNTPVCEGTPLNLTSTVSPANATLSWTGPNNYTASVANPTIASAQLTASGLYGLTATLNGCDALVAESVLVQVNDTPDAPAVAATSPVCAGFALDLSTTATADVYQWSGPGGWTSTLQNPTRAPMTATDAGTYGLVVITNNCPSPVSNVGVQVIDASFLPQIVSNSPVCEGQTLTFSTPNVTGAQYFWSGPSGFANNLSNFNLPQSTLGIEGNYNLYLVIGQCTTATNTFAADIVPIPVADAGLDVGTCSMAPVQLGAAPVPGYVYNWSPVDGLNFTNVSNPFVTMSNVGGQPVTHEYILNVTFDGCTDADTVLATINPQPVAFFETPNPQCFEGNSFDFQAGGVYSSSDPRFVWEFGIQASVDSSAEQNPQDISFSTTGVHLVKLVIIDYGCPSNPYTAPALVNEMPVANFVPSDVVVCEPALVQFTNLSENSGPLEYAWDFGNDRFSNQPNPSMLYSYDGNYHVSLRVTNQQGCSNEYRMDNLITVHPTPEAGFNLYPGTLITITNPEIELTSLGKNATECVYVIGQDSIFQFNKRYSMPDTGVYRIVQILRNEFGCIDSTSMLLEVDLGYKVYIPTAFTPNDDGKNDRFQIYGEDIAAAQISVFNRWGELLYNSYDFQNGWDGTTRLSDKVAPGGVYLYVIKLVDKYGNTFDYDGTINLVR